MDVNLSEGQVREIIRCAGDPLYFLRTYCWLERKETTELLPFDPYDYQTEFMGYLSKRENVLILKSRRVGCSWTAAAYAAWLINFHKGVNVLFLSKKLTDAKKLLAKVKFILKNLALHDADKHELATKCPWLCGEINTDNQELFTVAYRDDGGAIVAESEVASLTTTSESGRSEGATLIFLDEFAFVKPDDEATWAAIKPTVARGGQWVICSCVTPDTHIFTEHGVRQMSDYINGNVAPGSFGTMKETGIYGRYGMRPCNTIYNSGIQPTRIITTEMNYQLECSLIHPVLVMRGGNPMWIRSRDLVIGDFVAIQRGMDCWGNETDISDCRPNINDQTWRYRNGIWEPPEHITADLAYLMGLMIGNGYVDTSGRNHRVNIATIDPDTISWLTSNGAGLVFKPQKDGIHVVASSVLFVDFLNRFGYPMGKKSPEKYVPDRIMRASKAVVVAFLQGLFDTDGCAKKNGSIQYTTASARLAEQVRYLLLNLGIATTLRSSIVQPSKRVRVSSLIHTIEVGLDARIFRDVVGFRSMKKQGRLAILNDKNASLRFGIPQVVDLVRSIRYKLPQLRGKTEISRIRRRISDDILEKEPERVSYQSARRILELYAEAADRPSYKRLSELVQLNYLWLKITDIQPSRSKVVDFSIPDGHSFISNGFISHNTPKGAGGVFHRLCMEAQRKENKSYKYKEVHWSEAGITQEEYDRAVEGMDEASRLQEWELQFIQSGNPVFNATDLAACYKPADEFPEVETELIRYHNAVGIYYSGVDTAVGHAHRKSKLKDYNCWISLTKTGIQAAAFYNKDPLSTWAGSTANDPDGGLVDMPGMTTRLHEQYRGPVKVEENGPGLTVLNRHRVPQDGESDLIPLDTKGPSKSRIIRNLMIAIESHAITITDLFTYQCLLAYQHGNVPGQYEAPPGQNDDPVIALGLAWDLMLEYGNMEFSWGDGSPQRRVLTPQSMNRIDMDNAPLGPETIPVETLRLSEGLPGIGRYETQLDAWMIPDMSPYGGEFVREPESSRRHGHLR